MEYGLHLKFPQHSFLNRQITNPLYYLVFTILTVTCLIIYHKISEFFIFVSTVLTVILFANLLFKVFLQYSLISGYKLGYKVNKFTNLKQYLKTNSFPKYTILIPLYQENALTITNLIININRVLYHRSFLQVLFVTEEHDTTTLEILKNQTSIANFLYQIIEVPDSMPKTKPKACNFAMNFVEGDFLVIYDAEDKPDRFQLLKVLEFALIKPNFGCIQAKLRFYNYSDNLLSQLFQIEYISLFDHQLPILSKISKLIPLGGTSCHFRVSVLKEVGCWDPYNVTEDADLGVRLGRFNYKTFIIDSYTWEEAPITFMNWLHQRVRWLKGYMQTHIVHSKSSVALIKNVGLWEFLIFQNVISMGGFGFIMALLANILGAVGYGKHSALFILNIMLFLGMYIFFSLNVRLIHRQRHISIYACLLYPLYFILHTLANIMAFAELFINPYFWYRTTRKDK